MGASAQEEVREPTRLYSPAALVSMIQRGEPIVLLDVREPEEFAENHIPGALNIPQRELEARREELPRDALVIPYCNMDFRGFVAVEQLRELGVVRVGLMQKRGIYGWRDQGLPIVEPGRGLSDADALSRLRAVPVEGLAGRTATPRVEPSGRVTRVQMEVSEWYFDPNDLEVELGDRVEIELSSVKGDHYFILPDFEIQRQVRAGETASVSFVADRKGTFRFGSCEWDGAALQVMKGRISVE